MDPSFIFALVFYLDSNNLHISLAVTKWNPRPCGQKYTKIWFDCCTSKFASMYYTTPTIIINDNKIMENKRTQIMLIASITSMNLLQISLSSTTHNSAGVYINLLYRFPTLKHIMQTLIHLSFIHPICIYCRTRT